VRRIAANIANMPDFAEATLNARGAPVHFFDETDDTPEKRVGKVIGGVFVAILYSGIAALMLYAALSGLRWIS
jgi:hypothetical protein